MLDELAASNLGLIASASISVSGGLTVVTGETGTGKTLMLGALRLLRGDAAAKGLIGPHAEGLDVSGRFVVGTTETVARRSVSPSRSKAYLDGAISTASALVEEVGPLISIVGQHDQHTITSSAGIRSLVDRLLDEDGRAARESFDVAWGAYVEVGDEAAALGGDHRALEREREMLTFQVSEIDDAGFEPGDEETLRGQVARLRSAESLTVHLKAVVHSLGEEGASHNLSAALGATRTATNLDPSLSDINERIDELLIDLGDVLSDVVRYTDGLTSNPVELASTESRLAALGVLKRKYGDTIEDVATFRKDAAERAESLRELLSSAADIEERLESARAALDDAGSVLTRARVQAGERLAAVTTGHLADLGFADPIVRLSVESTQPTSHGADAITLLFASDASLKPAPASAVASGGELSRLVLALTLAAGGADADVVAFDEIDAGLGGSTALAMGRKLSALAEARQVICVTHLPQVAAFGSAHLVVERDGTTATIHPVNGERRVAEISRMLAGLSESDLGQQHAAELLELAAGTSS